MQIDPNQIYERLVTLGEEWAEANSVAELLEESKKSLVSQLSGDSNESSMAARESWALRSDEYKSHVKAMVTARKAANKAKVRYDSAKVWANLCQTRAANDRATLRQAP